MASEWFQNSAIAAAMGHLPLCAFIDRPRWKTSLDRVLKELRYKNLYTVVTLHMTIAVDHSSDILNRLYECGAAFDPWTSFRIDGSDHLHIVFSRSKDAAAFMLLCPN